MPHILKFLLVAAVLLASPAQAQPSTSPDPQDVLNQLLTGPEPSEKMFAPDFLAAVPIGEVRRILAETRKTIGSVQQIEQVDGRFRVLTATHEMPAEIALDASGRITGLLFRPPIPRGQSLDGLLEELATLPGEVAFIHLEDGIERHARAPDTPLAVGSAFKLAVLAVLRDRIESGDAEWTDIAALEKRHVSLPSGLLQTFPEGAPLTLHTLAALMISISDNTATDMLIDYLGREALRGQIGSDPALKTRDLFILKADDELRLRYLQASRDERAAILQQLDATPVTGAGTAVPHVPGLEWYLSVRRLCDLMARVGDLDVLAISPGPVDRQNWSSLAFKGAVRSGS